MKIAILFVTAIGLAVALATDVSVDKRETIKVVTKDFLAKQKFLLEIVYRVEEPLMFEDYIRIGEAFIYNTDDYRDSEYLAEMEDYYRAYKYGATLGNGEFFGAMIPAHHQQLTGLFGFMYYAKNWEIFKRIVCWARLHANEAMFVHALTMTVLHREDFESLLLPTIYEIFPQYFINSKFIKKAEKFDCEVWSRENKTRMQGPGNFHTKDWKMWQWWKLMGLDEHWYTEDRFIMRGNIENVNKDSIFLDMMKEIKFFWMPVDYTRDIDFYNRESKLSYLTEDLDWNAMWYYLNMDYAPLLYGPSFGLKDDRRGEFWIEMIRQILARYYMERLSHGYGEIPEFSYFAEIKNGYKPQLIHYNGLGFSSRHNYYEFQSHGNSLHFSKVQDFFRRLEDILTQGYYMTAEGKTIDMSQPESFEYIADILQGNVDVYDSYFMNFWYMHAHMWVANVNVGKKIRPNIFLNYETMMRDPMFYVIYKKIHEVFYKFHHYTKPYTHKELLFPGVTIKDVQVSDLVTYFDLFDFDVSNLLRDTMNFVDGQLVWNKTLLARQMRLNHKPYDFKFAIESDKWQKVSIRTYLAPKYDEYGRVFSLSQTRRNVLQIDEFVYDLNEGANVIKRTSDDNFWTFGDRSTYTELYRFVKLAHEGNYEYPMNFNGPHCTYPDRLLLPRGWKEGMPMQLFFFVAPVTVAPYSTFDKNSTCGVGSGSRFVDERPIGYPFEREINEYAFFVPNMLQKDVKIYHEDLFAKYWEGNYEGVGSFDYNYKH